MIREIFLEEPEHNWKRKTVVRAVAVSIGLAIGSPGKAQDVPYNDNLNNKIIYFSPVLDNHNTISLDYKIERD